MSPQVDVGSAVKNHVKKYTLSDKLKSILTLLGSEAQPIIDWAYDEAKRRIQEDKIMKKAGLGSVVFDLIGYEAAVRLVRNNQAKGRMTTKNEIRVKTGQKVEMPLLYRDAGLRHPQEARNLRHNMFHEAFTALILHLFPDVTTSVPSTGEGLTPDLMVHHRNPDWTISVEYKGYRALTLLSESEILKAMRYQADFGTSWLITTTPKSSIINYSKTLNSQELVERGISRLKMMYKRKAYTVEQKENRGIAKKGISHLEKHQDLQLKCKLYTAKELLESMHENKPVKGVIISTGCEFVEMLKEAGLHQEADDVLRVMKLPAAALHSDTITSVRLIG